MSMDRKKNVPPSPVPLDVSDPLAVRMAGLRALTEALGPEGREAFMRQSIYRNGDMVAEK